MECKNGVLQKAYLDDEYKNTSCLLRKLKEIGETEVVSAQTRQFKKEEYCVDSAPLFLTCAFNSEVSLRRLLLRLSSLVLFFDAAILTLVFSETKLRNIKGGRMFDC